MKLFLVSGQTLFLRKGGDCFFAVFFSPLPAPLDGSELPVNQRQSVFPNGTLLLETVDKAKDQGEYTCSVDSGTGTTVQQTVRVIVRSKDGATSLRFLTLRIVQTKK